MPPSDMQRLELLEEASKAFGREPAETLMESLPPHDWEQIATKDDLETLRTATKADLAALRTATKADLETLRTATKADLETLRTATKADLETLRTATKADLVALTAKIDGQFVKIDGRFTELRGEMQAMEGRLDRRASRDLYFIVATTVGTMLAFAASIWVALLRNPLG